MYRKSDSKTRRMAYVSLAIVVVATMMLLAFTLVNSDNTTVATETNVPYRSQEGKWVSSMVFVLVDKPGFTSTVYDWHPHNGIVPHFAYIPYCALEFDAGTHEAEVMLVPGYAWKIGDTDSIKVSWEIIPREVKDVEIVIEKQEYNGTALKPKMNVFVEKHRVAETRDFDATFTDNTEIGKATVNLTFKGNFKGSATGTFEIVKDLNEPSHGPQEKMPMAMVAVAAVGLVALVGVGYFIFIKKP